MNSITLFLSIVGTVAACIAAIPVISSWMPIKLTDKEKKLLELALKYDDYPGVLRYCLIPPNDRGSSCVNAPYKSETIEVKFEILELRDKGLISVMDGNSQSRGEAVWYQLTRYGYKVAKKLPISKP